MIDMEESLVKELTKKFVFLEGKCIITRERRISVEAPKKAFLDIIGYAASKLKFEQLCAITGLDAGENLEFIYHLANREGIMLNLKLTVSKANPEINTVTAVYNGAIFYERELEDLLGAKVAGLPREKHYPLPENWPEGQYPLRKDWKPDAVQQK